MILKCGTFHNCTEYVCITVNLFKQEVAERRLCMLGGGEDDTGLEFDEEFVTGSEMQRFQRQVTSGGNVQAEKDKVQDSDLMSAFVFPPALQPKRKKKCCSVS